MAKKFGLLVLVISAFARFYFLGIFALLVVFSGCVAKEKPSNSLFSAQLDSGTIFDVKKVEIFDQFIYVDEKKREISRLAPNGTSYYVLDVVFSNPTNEHVQFPSTGLGLVSKEGTVYFADLPSTSSDVSFENGVILPGKSHFGNVRIAFYENETLDSFLYDLFSKEKRFQLPSSKIGRSSEVLTLSPNFGYEWVDKENLVVNFTFSLGNKRPLRGEWKMFTEIMDESGNSVNSNLLKIVTLPANNSVRASSKFKLPSGNYFAKFSVFDDSTNRSFSDELTHKIGAE